MTEPTVENANPNPGSSPDGRSRRFDLDYLRAVIVSLVVFHHSVLAYVTFAYINPEKPIATFSPVVDSERWDIFDLAVIFNDTFFMALMFLISGLFVWRSLQRKGTGAYLKGRFMRLGLPFVIAVPLIIPLAYYPAQLTVELVHGGDSTLVGFWLDLLKSGVGTAGPLWFIWLLLVFDIIFCLIYLAAPKFFERFSRSQRKVLERPLPFFAFLLVASLAVYLPLALTLGPAEWWGAGPFYFQISRVLLYLFYFLTGVALGAYGLERSLLKTATGFAKSWWVWLHIGLVFYVGLVVALVIGSLPALVGSVVFTVTCTALSLTALAMALRFFRKQSRVWDSLARSAYGIYIVHYLFVNWLQYWMLGAELPAAAKGLLVFTGALLLSWGFTATVKRIPGAAKVI